MVRNIDYKTHIGLVN